MRHKTWRLENLCERRVANAEASGIGAEGRHHSALAIAGKTAPLHRAAARAHPGLGMQMSGDFTRRTGRLMTKRDRTYSDFAGDHAAKIGPQCRIVTARN